MALPQNNKLPISALAGIFNNTSATYKFYWFVALMEIVVKERKTKISFWEIIAGMIANYFELTTQEQNALWQMVDHCKKILENRFLPDGFNVGINVNESAGQSVFHIHIHLIPRYKGDVANPKGGVRGVIPGKQNY